MAKDKNTTEKAIRKVAPADRVAIETNAAQATLKALGYSLKKASEELGLSSSYFAKSAKRGYIPRVIFAKMADKWGITEDDLIPEVTEDDVAEVLAPQEDETEAPAAIAYDLGAFEAMLRQIVREEVQAALREVRITHRTRIDFEYDDDTEPELPAEEDGKEAA
jgi:transcriptional regulator with XRE-family HTH domain